MPLLWWNGPGVGVWRYKWVDWIEPGPRVASVFSNRLNSDPRFVSKLSKAIANAPDPQSANPSDPDSVKFLNELLDEVWNAKSTATMPVTP